MFFPKKRSDAHEITTYVKKSQTTVEDGYESMCGRIVSEWRREGDTLTLKVTVPANAAATVHVPTKDAATVEESDRPASQSQGVTFLRMEGGAAVYAVLSGSYQFKSKL
jgi:alpha-L-rhamnosidase